MASTYTSAGLEKPADGEQDGTWGDTVNDNSDILDRLTGQAGAITLSGTTHTLTISDGALSEGQYAILNFGGTPSGTNTVTISPNTAKRVFWATNNSGQSVVLTQGSGGDVTIADGSAAYVYCDGAGAAAEVVDATAGVTTQFGGISFADGSAAAPSVTFTSDPNTGVYGDGADSLTFVTAGVDRMKIGPAGGINIPAVSTETKNITMGLGRSGDGASYLDLIGDATYTGYGTRLIRNAGATGNTLLAHRGSGNVIVDLEDGGGVFRLDIGATANILNIEETEAVVNEGAADVDFRVEGTATPNLIRTDAANGRVGFNIGTPLTDVDINGQLAVAAGTAAAPSHSFRTDLDTGMFSTGANGIGFSTGGVQRMDIGSGGDLNLPAVSTETKQINIGNGRSGDGASLIDFIADGVTYTSYGLRIVRNSGANGSSQIDHRGTGNLNITTNEAAALVFQTDSTTRMSIGAGGDTTVNGTLLPSASVRANAGTFAAPAYGFLGDGDTGMFSASANRLSFTCAGAEVLRLENDQVMHDQFGSAAAPSFSWRADPDTGMYRYSTNAIGFATGGSEEVRITTTGMVITGSLSKGSGSFRIPHPIREGHDLVHSFVEGPQADNIYRGKATLVNGVATVNLDTASRMTEGTFVALNGNVQCFTSNETNWTPVRGRIEDNILTIEAQDQACTATVSWLVIGERHDQHMLDADWTDENGRVITEPLTEVPDDTTGE